MDTREDNFSGEVYSKALKAGKRTYFFDVKQTKNKEKYLVITESKKVFNDMEGSFDFEKHKIFLYKEDYDKFARMLENMIDYIRTGAEIKDEIYQRQHQND